MDTFVITKYGDRELENIAVRAGEWLAEYLSLKDVKKVVIDINPNLVDCWGKCGERNETEDRFGCAYATYEISVQPKQSLRDFIATIVHEFIHISQRETGEWDGDGEAEANYCYTGLPIQYSIADRMWKERVL